MKKLTDILNEIKINNPLAVAARDRASKEQEMDEIKINHPYEQIIWNWNTARSSSENDYSEIYKVWGKSNLYNYFGYFELELGNNGKYYNIENKNIREKFGEFIEIQRWSKDGEELIDGDVLGKHIDSQGNITINEIKINQPDPKRPPALIEVVKDRYLCSDQTREGDYYSKDEIDDTFFHMFVVGDVWKLKKNEDREYYYECIKGVFKGESTDEIGWEYDDTTEDFFKILKR